MAKRILPDSGKPRKSIDEMNLDELMAHNRELLAKLNRLLTDRSQRPDIDAMSDEQRREYQDHLMRRISAHIDTLNPPTPEPTPIVEEAPAYHLPTKRMKKAVERFDSMTDGEQVDNLKAMW